MIKTLNVILEGKDDPLLRGDFEARNKHHIKVGVCWFDMEIVSRRETYDPRSGNTLYVYDLMVP